RQGVVLLTTARGGGYTDPCKARLLNRSEPASRDGREPGPPAPPVRFLRPTADGEAAVLFELYHHDDLSLGEIAEQHGVSRQAVYDILKRAERTLEELESKLQLVERFLRERQVVEE